MLHYEYTNAIKDGNAKHTHWERVVYNEKLLARLKKKLLLLYRQLKNETGIGIGSIDFCEYANSMPFRINIITKNNKQDFFYIKSADASRIYGLLLEQLLTDNHINFLYRQNTLVEEHIEGVPGDDFLETISILNKSEMQLMAESFIRFNESCFARLLGDMCMLGKLEIVTFSLVSNTAHKICKASFFAPCGHNSPLSFLPPIT